jgi:hypothetical protein
VATPKRSEPKTKECSIVQLIILLRRIIGMGYSPLKGTGFEFHTLSTITPKIWTKRYAPRKIPRFAHMRVRSSVNSSPRHQSELVLILKARKRK